MEEVADLVLLERLVLTGEEARRRRLLDRQARGVDVLPVLDRDAPRLQELPVRTECLARVRDRLVTRSARGVASRQRRDARDEVGVASLQDEDLRLVLHAAIHTF